MAAASYDQLLRQVEVLKMENSNLRQELQDNSNHLTKLETEASNMKVSDHIIPVYYWSAGNILMTAAAVLQSKIISKETGDTGTLKYCTKYH